MGKYRTQTQSPLSIHLQKITLLLSWVSFWLPCLFLSPQPPPLSPSCTRSVLPWGASPCHGLSRSNPMASFWTMRSGTTRRWATFDPRLLRSPSGGHKEIGWRTPREEELGAGRQETPGGESWDCLTQVLFIDLGESLQIHHLIVWILHWAVETTTLCTAMYFLSQGGCDKNHLVLSTFRGFWSLVNGCFPSCWSHASNSSLFIYKWYACVMTLMWRGKGMHLDIWKGEIKNELT